MPYSEKDFKECLFNPMNKQAMSEAYPDLMERLVMPEKILPGKRNDQILRYICALYDSKSPLHKEKVLERRQMEAAEVAGFDPKTDKAFLQELFDFRDENSNLLTLQYLRVFMKARLWAMIVSSEAAFWSATSELMNPDTELDVLKTIQVQDKTHERLNEFYKQFFADTPGLEAVVNRPKKISPELIALNGKQ